mmetsp:Transcript_22960/g.54872  ORF Transcript_22960/g.54872 Transcript_22960/m.54872 type:complete len:195 (+) Transcript_22960:233-817(+)
MDGLMIDVENRASSAMRPAAGKLQGLGGGGGGGLSAQGGAKGLPTPKRRALGDITNSRGNAKTFGTPAGKGGGAGLGSSVKGANVSKLSVFTPKKVEAVEEVDTASRMAEPEAPFFDPLLDASLGLLLSAEGSELRGGATLLPDTLAFLPAEFEEVFKAFGEEDGTLAMLLEDDEAASLGFDLADFGVRDDAED